MTPEDAKAVGAFIATALCHELPEDMKLEINVRGDGLPLVRFKLTSTRGERTLTLDRLTSVHAITLSRLGAEHFATFIMNDLRRVWENHYDISCDH